MLWLDMITGEMHAWKNMGNIPAAGTASSFTWTYKGMVAVGQTCRGSAIELVNFAGLGRADYYLIVPQTNTASVWLNLCPPGGGLGPATPNLPTGAPDIPAITVGKRVTTDGTCSANVVCGSWSEGSCCTGGFCGGDCGSACISGCLG